MKVTEFIDWLKTQDQNAEVYVMVGDMDEETEYGEYDWVEFNPVYYSSYCDWSKFPWTIGTKFENKKTLYLGLKM
jgi:hypothetical protein